MANVVTKSVTIKVVNPTTGAITGTGREWPYTTDQERLDLAQTVIPEQRAIGGIVYDRVSTTNTTTGVVTITDTPIPGLGRDNTAKTVTGPAWAWYLLLAALRPNLGDPTVAWLYDAIEAQTGLTLEYTPAA